MRTVSPSKAECETVAYCLQEHIVSHACEPAAYSFTFSLLRAESLKGSQCRERRWTRTDRGTESNLFLGHFDAIKKVFATSSQAADHQHTLFAGTCLQSRCVNCTAQLTSCHTGQHHYTSLACRKQSDIGGKNIHMLVVSPAPLAPQQCPHQLRRWLQRRCLPFWRVATHFALYHCWLCWGSL